MSRLLAGADRDRIAAYMSDRPRGNAGVIRDRTGAYVVQVHFDRRYHYGGRWSTLREAKIAADRLRLHFGHPGPFHYPAASRRLGPCGGEELKHLARRTFRERRGAYIGVSWSEQYERWEAYVGRTPKVALGTWESAEEAARVRDRVVRHLRLDVPLNFPESMARPLTPDEARRLAHRRLAERYTSVYRGVLLDPNEALRRPWNASIGRQVNGRNVSHHLGRWGSENDAARAYDRAALYYFGPTAALNFPRLRKRYRLATARVLRDEAHAEYKKTTSSRYRGVSRTARGKWAAGIGHGHRRTSLGHFDDEEAAAHAYDRAARRLHGAKAKLNFP